MNSSDSKKPSAPSREETRDCEALDRFKELYPQEKEMVLNLMRKMIRRKGIEPVED